MRNRYDYTKMIERAEVRKNTPGVLYAAIKKEEKRVPSELGQMLLRKAAVRLKKRSTWWFKFKTRLLRLFGWIRNVKCKQGKTHQ